MNNNTYSKTVKLLREEAGVGSWWRVRERNEKPDVMDYRSNPVHRMPRKVIGLGDRRLARLEKEVGRMRKTRWFGKCSLKRVRARATEMNTLNSTDTCNLEKKSL